MGLSRVPGGTLGSRRQALGVPSQGGRTEVIDTLLQLMRAVDRDRAETDFPRSLKCSFPQTYAPVGHSRA